MFLDYTKTPIEEGDEFIVALNSLIYHGIQMDEVEYPEIRHRKNEELLIIECISEYGNSDNFLQLKVYRCKKGEDRILPNVVIHNR